MGVKRYSIDVDSDESLIEFSKADSLAATERMSLVLSETDSVRKALEIQKGKVAKRELIMERQRSRYNKKLEELERSRDRFEESERRLYDANYTLRARNQRLRRLDEVLQDGTNRVKKLNEIFSCENTLRHKAATLHELKSRLDPSCPIRYSIESEGEDPDSYTQKLVFRTAKFPMVCTKDGKQLLTKTHFGPFDVKICRRWSGHAVLYADVYFLEGSITSVGGDYRHPHISSNGEICLGSAKTQVLEMMGSGDYSGVIRHTMDVMSSYNPNDPYKHIDYWEPLMQGALCKSCNEMLYSCGCSHSTVSGALLKEGFTNDCGLPFSECHAQHDRTNVTDEGINGSPCVPSPFSIYHCESYLEQFNQLIENHKE